MRGQEALNLGSVDRNHQQGHLLMYLGNLCALYTVHLLYVYNGMKGISKQVQHLSQLSSLWYMFYMVTKREVRKVR